MYSYDSVESVEEALGLGENFFKNNSRSINGNVTQFDPDAEIENLQNQIEDTESAIQSIKLSIKEKEQRYESELAEIQEQINEADSFANEQLQIQQAEFENEIKELKKQYEEEISNFEATMSRNLAENSKWANFRNELLILGDQAKIVDMERKTETEKAIFLESKSINDVREAQKQLQRRNELLEYERKIRELENEVSSLQSSRRESTAEYRLTINEITEKIETKARDHAMLIQKMTAELEQRDIHFTQHTQSVKQMTEKERITANTDLQIAINKIESLKNIYQSVNRRGSVQLQSMTRDIEKLSRSIEDIKKNEEMSNEKAREQMIKLQSMQKEIKYYREMNQAIQNEITRLNSINQYAYSELQKASIQPKTKEPSYKRSIFYH
ncbi:hypothetical protein TRFO_05952 [Tritrichomonas foetus]|uniref:Uncharacterized protein n=1 Tax=Tritrichomonas foetus TaxID=1144522 RepID=A0A1J4K1Q4_9EUKA|nr:hypothetical protein TRFO_05952 [Tritrichomonas foetus]|eukprot:OHT05369.1 hypothetical protein TRFO_05952 [Tritrichomonas foetus]